MIYATDVLSPRIDAPEILKVAPEHFHNLVRNGFLPDAPPPPNFLADLTTCAPKKIYVTFETLQVDMVKDTIGRGILERN